MPKQRIIAVHLLNDFSGSPFVFSQALQALQKNGYEIHLFTATPSGAGFLSTMQGINTHVIYYRWSRFKLLTLFFFLISQASLFLRITFAVRKSDLVYVNSMLPFGAALAGKLRGVKVLYHIHEVSIQPALLKKWLLWVVQLTAWECIYVSKYLQQNTPVTKKGLVIYNALPYKFTKQANRYNASSHMPFTVLMLCSLKKYKGIYEFIECARQLPALSFILVLNASEKELQDFFGDLQLPINCNLYPAQQNVHPFYQKSSVVVNFSLVDQWIETFGMTMLEAMYYKKPVIIPPVGGITELVTHGVNGFVIDSCNIPLLTNALQTLASNAELYSNMSAAAYAGVAAFSTADFERAIICAVATITNKEKENLNVFINT